MHDPAAASWRPWKLPGAGPTPYAVYVDERDTVWPSDCGSNAVLRSIRRPRDVRHASRCRTKARGVRQILGRPGEVWLPESGTEHITVIRAA